jgi:hypothetical protein
MAVVVPVELGTVALLLQPPISMEQLASKRLPAKRIRSYATCAPFKGYSGVPVLPNASFNGNGEPIVDTVADAMQNFLRPGARLSDCWGLAPRSAPDWQFQVRRSHYCLSGEWQLTVVGVESWTLRSSWGTRCELPQSLVSRAHVIGNYESFRSGRF